VYAISWESLVEGAQALPSATLFNLSDVQLQQAVQPMEEFLSVNGLARLTEYQLAGLFVP
jgi:hypothetical protein